jgi:hypothetical protein
MKIDTLQENEIITMIKSDWDLFHAGREDQLADIDELQRLIFESPKSEITYGEKYEIPEVYKLWDTLRSYLNNSVFSTNENLFDVRGQDEPSQELAQKHKYDIVDDLENCNFKQIMQNEASYNFALSGELIVFVGNRTKEIYRKRENAIDLLDAMENENYIPKAEKVIEYEGVGVTEIATQDFVFDIYNPDFNSSTKIIRKYLSYKQIINTFQLDKNEKEYFLQLSKNNKPSSCSLQDTTQKRNSNYTTSENNGLIEVLEFWGDIILNDGTILENQKATIAGDKLLELIDNPFYNNPIVFYAPITSPLTRRGISPLRVSIIPNSINNNIINTMLDSLALITSPCWFMPKGALASKDIKIAPSVAIEYEPTVTARLPEKIDFSSALGATSSILPLFSSHIQEATGISDNMAGAISDTRRTATELSIVASAGSLRINNITTLIQDNFILPVIKTIAEHKRNNENGEKNLVVRDGSGNSVEEKITKDVRDGKYRYIYMDTKTAVERQSRFKEFLDFIGLFIKLAPEKINISEIFKYGASIQNISDIEKFVNPDIIDKAIGEITEQQGVQLEKQDMDAVKQYIVELMPEILQSMIQRIQQPQGGLDGQQGI